MAAAVLPRRRVDRTVATRRNTLAGACQPGCGWPVTGHTRKKVSVRSGIDITWAREVPAEPVTVGDVTVTPRARALVVRLPQAGFVWNRPVAVTVERAGAVRRIPVVDITRVLQLGLLGLGLAIGVAIPRRSDPKRR
jgi:hypothetical protein